MHVYIVKCLPLRHVPQSGWLEHPSPHTIASFFVVVMVATLQLCFHGNLQVYNKILLTIVTMPYSIVNYMIAGLS